ncbi:MAG: lipopolysaccharide biosynthesis protein [Acidobacteria bacterium]|nr:lipopolysaccharide biosynthesis protein [Acidobacteriota bacterium]
MLLRVTLSGLLAATLMAFLLPKEYVSTTQLMPPDNHAGANPALLAGLSSPAIGLAGKASDLLGMKSSGALFVSVLRSRTVEDRLIERFSLKKVYGVKLLESARTQLAGVTSISEDRKSGIITITVTDRDPQRAAALAHGYVDELDRLVAELSTSAAHRERVFLEERLKTIRRDLEAAERDFSQFASKNTAIDIQVQGRAMVEAAATLQGQLIAAQSELEGLKQIYTDSNVRVRSVRARIGELQRQLEKLGGKAPSNQRAADDPADSLYPSIRELPLLGVTYADLHRRTKIQETVYEILTQQYELAKVQEAKETPSVKVLDAADVPERKSFPPRRLIVIAGTLFASGFAIVWVLGRALWRETDPLDPRKIFAQEVLTTVKAHSPWASQNGSRLSVLTGKVWRKLSRRQSQTEEGK